MKKTISILMVLYIIFSQITIANATQTINELPEIEILSESAVLIDADSGKVLYNKNMHEKLYPASITKIMTVLLALDNGKLDDNITFSNNAVFSIEPGSSHIAVDEGEILTLEQSLYAIILQSANEVSNGVAEHIGGSIDGFVQMMNSRAKLLGAENTNFVNANGLHNENHYTTAYDMALIMRELIKHEEFKTIAKTIHYVIPPTNKKTEQRDLYAQNQMVKPPSAYLYDACEGGKTGFTNEAQNTLVTTAKKDSLNLIAVVLKAKGADAYKDSITLYDYGFNNFEKKEIFSPDSFSKSTQVLNALNDETEIKLYAKESVFAVLPKSASIKDINQETNYPATLTAPISKDFKAGEVLLSYNEEVIGKAELFTAIEIPGKPSVDEKKNDIKSTASSILKLALIVLLCVIIILIIAFMCLRLYYRMKWKKKHRRKKRR